MTDNAGFKRSLKAYFLNSTLFPTNNLTMLLNIMLSD